jgi:ABC-type multidrug transport system permease subunit
MALYAGGVFFGAGKKFSSQAGWASLMGFCFFVGANSLMVAMSPMAIVFPSEKSVFLKESGAKLYGAGSYFLSRNIVELPFSILFPTIQSLIYYWMAGLTTSAFQFFTFFLILYLISFSGTSIGLLVGSIAQFQSSVAMVLALFIYTFYLFSGMFKNLNNFPSYINWLQYINPIRYTFAAFMQNEVPESAQSRVSELNFSTDLWGSVGLLALLGVVYRLMAYFVLWVHRGKLQ